MTMPKKSTSLLLCFPTSSSTPSLAGAASGVMDGSRHRAAGSSSLGSSLLSAVYFFFLLFANLTLLCVGSLFLSWLEQPAEAELRRHLAAKRAHFVELYLHNSTRPAAALDELLELVQDAAQKGIMGTIQPSIDAEFNSIWSFGSAFLFLTTIATTVGYGHAAPQSSMGKAFSMIYGTIAIPLLLAFFSELIRKLVTLLNWIFMLTMSHRCRRQTDDASSGNLTSSPNVTVKVIFVIAISLALIGSTVFVPAFIFTLLETQWTFLDGLYYCFISMTTVGLGDVIPGESPEWSRNAEAKELYHISIAVYLLVALPLFFLAIKLISSLVTTAEMTFRMPFCVGNDADAHIGGTSPNNRRNKMATKPRIKVSRGEAGYEADDNDDDEDDDSMYDASTGLIGRTPIRHDSDTQLTSDGDDDSAEPSCESLLKQTGKPAAVIPGDIKPTTFSYLFPQPQSNPNKSSH